MEGTDRDVPPFKEYWPSTSDMNREQRQFYDYLKHSIDQDIYPDVKGNISYLFTYVYTLFDKIENNDLMSVYTPLINIAEKYYHETKFHTYCKIWSYDCLLASRNYEMFITVTEQGEHYDLDIGNSNMRCNINRLLKKEIDPIDLVILANPKYNQYTIDHFGEYKSIVRALFLDASDKMKSWLENGLTYQHKRNPGNWNHFANTKTPIQAEFTLYIFYTSYRITQEVGEFSRNAENVLRELNNLPRIGEGWIKETELYYAVKQAFPETRVIHHGKPYWLGLQHFDIWIPNWNIAIEYHGEQHFQPVDFFGGKESYEATVLRDRRKEELCSKNGVNLIIASSETPHDEIIARVRAERYD